MTCVDLFSSSSSDLPPLKDHFIIIGLSIQFYKKFIMQMNLVTQKPLVFVGDQSISESFLNSLLKKKTNYNYNFKNVYLVTCDILSSAHLSKLQIP